MNKKANFEARISCLPAGRRNPKLDESVKSRHSRACAPERFSAQA
jgi:hypothetical protein